MTANASSSSRRRPALAATAAAVFGAALSLAACTENPYKADTWIKQLGDKGAQARAIVELDRLGDPKAIPALAKTWESAGRDPKILDVIISLAKPFTPEEVAEAVKTNRNDPRKFMLRDFPKGRPASWDKALPVLIKVLSDVDDLDDRWRESASKAAAAIGESKDASGIDILVETVNRKMNAKAERVRLDAIIALGKFKDPKAVEALSNVIRADVKEQDMVLFAAAINALGDMRSADAVPALIEVMYRLPPMFAQVRRALAASGASVGQELRKILRGEHTAVETLFKEKKLGVYCGDEGKPQRPAAECEPVSAKDYYPAMLLGDMNDPAAVPDLLAALKRPALPVYYSDDTPAQLNQHQAIYQTLQKLGSPESAADVKAVWSDAKAPSAERVLALTTYALVARDTADIPAMVAIAGGQDDQDVRVAATLAVANLATSDANVSTLQAEADKYAKMAAEQRVQADAKKPAYDKAKAAQDEAKKAQSKAADESKQLAAKALKDKSVTTDDLAKATAAATAANKVLETANEAFKKASGEFKPYDDLAKSYRATQRFFQTQIARVEIAMRCKGEGACFVKAIPENFDKASLDKKADEIAGHLGTYIKDLGEWTAEEKRGLVSAQVDRAMVEIGKLGSKAADLTPALLNAAKSEDGATRGAVLLALPKVAKVPCAECETALDAIIAAAEGKSTLQAMTADTQMVRNYFSWAGK